MKRLLYLSVIAIAVIAAWSAPAGPIAKGYTFSTNEQVTAAKLHSLVDDATVSGLTGANITDGSIAAIDLGANSVITAKIQDLAVTAGKLGALSVESAKIATNAVGTAQLATNLDLSAKTITLATNQIPSYAIAGTNAGPGIASQVPILGADGLIAGSLIGYSSTVLSTNITRATGSGSANTWAEIGRITTTATTGSVLVVGSAITFQTGGAYTYLRLRDAETNAVRAAGFYTAADVWFPQQVTLTDTLAGSAKTYVFECAANVASMLVTNTLAAPPISNGTSIRIFQLK